MKTVTLAYKNEKGFVKHVQCTESNPKDFKAGQKYIVLSDVNPVVRIVESEKQAEKLNKSIINENWIRRVIE